MEIIPRRNTMAILVTGGTGFIGSHTVVELLNAGKEVIIVDNFSNSKPVVLDRIEKITGKRCKLIEADLLDYDKIENIFKENKILIYQIFQLLFF